LVENLTPINADNGKLEAFYLLLLSEGYNNTVKEKNNFNSFCKVLTKNLFMIDPFNICKDRFKIFTHFVSNENIGGVIKTPFKISVNAGNNFEMENINKLGEILEDIQTNTSDGSKTGTEIWNNIALSNTAVCIIKKGNHVTGGISEINFSSFEEEMQYIGIKLIIIPTFPLPKLVDMTSTDSALEGLEHIENWDEFSNKYRLKCCTALLVKNIGEMLGLQNEAESSIERQYITSEWPTLTGPNIVSHNKLFSTTDNQIDNIPWKRLMFIPSQKNISEKEHPHPDGDIQSISTKTDYQKIIDDGETAPIAVKHTTERENGSGLSLQLDYINNKKERNKFFQWGKPNLFEGGADYTHGIYRSRAECLMREPGYAVKYANKKKFFTVPFCHVCRNYLRGILCGNSEWVLWGTTIDPGPTQYRGQLHSHTAKIFYRFIREIEFSPFPRLKKFKVKGNKTGGKWHHCVGATNHRVKVFFKNLRSWNQGMDKFGLSDEGKNKGYNGENAFYPKTGRNVKAVHALWNTVPKQIFSNQRIDSRFKDYFMLGAAGALTYIGLGSLKNEFYLKSVQVNEKTITYPIAQSLTIDDLQTLEKGSIMQIWPSQAQYEEGLKYLLGIQNANETLVAIQSSPNNNSEIKPKEPEPFDKPPKIGRNIVKDVLGRDINKVIKIPGHSLVYMGDNKFADQHRLDADLLTDPLWKEYKFWIAAQWYDSKNLAMKLIE